MMAGTTPGVSDGIASTQATASAYALRAAQAADAAALAAFAQAAFRETFAYRAYPPEDLAAFFASKMSPARYAALLDDPAMHITLAVAGDGAICGFASAGPVDLPLPDGAPRTAVIELHQLYLAPYAQGTGLADALMARFWATARAQAARTAYLSVYCENRRAQRFYARHGFAEIGKNPFLVGRVLDDDRIWQAAVPPAAQPASHGGEGAGGDAHG